MEIREWNIGMAATIPSNSRYKLKPWIIDEITKDIPDCIVLTEFVVSTGIEYFFKVLEEKGYHWLITGSTMQNGILIALKKSTFDFSETFDYKKENVNNNEVLFGKNLPDFLEVTVKWKEIPLSIIGTRIRVDLDKEDETKPKHKDSKRSQFDALDCYLASKHNNVICVGDFNAYWGSIWNTSKNFSFIETSKTYYIKTPRYKEGEWWSYVSKDKTNKNVFLQLDHMITNIDKETNNIEVKYDWNYINTSGEYPGISAGSYKPSGLPDHAILKILINDK